MHSSVIIHVPHASAFIPPEELKFFRKTVLQNELLVMTDHYCDDLFRCRHKMIKAPVSRLVCDMERFREDEDEIMSEVGMGAIYTKCSDGRILRQLSAEKRSQLLERYYDVHHKELDSAVRRQLNDFERCLIVDGHSFYPAPLPYELDQNSNRPDICIGTDSYHTSDNLLQYFYGYFVNQGLSVKINSPFTGTIVPTEFYHTDKRVTSIMIEVNRRLYINNLAKKTKNYEAVKVMLSNLLNSVC